jgi:hypothetical protein
MLLKWQFLWYWLLIMKFMIVSRPWNNRQKLYIQKHYEIFIIMWLLCAKPTKHEFGIAVIHVILNVDNWNCKYSCIRVRKPEIQDISKEIGQRWNTWCVWIFFPPIIKPTTLVVHRPYHFIKTKLWRSAQNNYKPIFLWMQLHISKKASRLYDLSQFFFFIKM